MRFRRTSAVVELTRSRGWRRAAAAAGLVLAATAGLAQAPPADPTGAEELRQRLRLEEEERLRRESAPAVRRERPALEADSLELPEEPRCFRIGEIRLDGADRGFSWARSYVERYRGRCIGEEGMNLIARRLTNRIVARGKATTRVGIPEQDVSTGTLRLVLIPGTIRRISFAEKGTRGLWQTALPARPGDVLDVRDLDQGLEQLKRVPSQDVEFAIYPGGATGESDLELKVKRTRPWRASLTLDDGGSSATGKLEGAATASLDSPLGLNDLLSVTGQHDAEFDPRHHGTWGANGFYSVPYGYWTLTMSGGTSRYKQTVAGGTETFAYRGRSTNAELSVQRVVHRDQASKTALELAIGKRWAKTYIEDVEIEVQRRDVTTASLTVSHRHGTGPATLDVSLGVRRGLPWLAQDDPGDEDPASPTTQYTLGTLEASLAVPLRPFGLPLRFQSRWRGQYTPDRVLVSDQFSIGGRYTVRGFDGERALMAERGWTTRNELGFTIPRVRQELYGGIDHGQVSGPAAADLDWKGLTGSVVGLRGGYRFISYDAFMGFALVRPTGFKTGQPALGFMVTAQY